MPITEAIMSQGSFSIDLANIGDDLRNSLTKYGRVIVTKNRPTTVVGMTATAARAEADFCGVLISRRDGMAAGLRTCTLTGYGLAALISDSEGSMTDGYYPILGAQTLTRFAGYVIEGDGTGSEVATTGLTVGTINSTYAGRTAPFQWSPTQMSAREALTYVCGYWGLEWRVLPTGVVNIGTIDELYGAPSKIVANRRFTSSGVTAYEMDGLSVEYDWSQWATKVVVQDVTDNNVELARSDDLADADLVNLNGEAVERVRYFEVPPGFDPDSATYVADLTTWCNNKLAELRLPRQIISVDGIRQAVVKDIGTGRTTSLTCGEWVYVHAPGLVGIDPTARVHIGGVHLTPIAIRVATTTKPVLDGMGVLYEPPDGSDALIDLSPYVVWEPDDGVEIG